MNRILKVFQNQKQPTFSRLLAIYLALNLFLLQVNDTTVLGAGGDYADFQFISDVSSVLIIFHLNNFYHLCQVIKQKQIDEDCKDDGFNMKPKV